MKASWWWIFTRNYWCVPRKEKKFSVFKLSYILFRVGSVQNELCQFGTGTKPICLSTLLRLSRMFTVGARSDSRWNILVLTEDLVSLCQIKRCSAYFKKVHQRCIWNSFVTPDRSTKKNDKQIVQPLTIHLYTTIDILSIHTQDTCLNIWITATQTLRGRRDCQKQLCIL